MMPRSVADRAGRCMALQNFWARSKSGNDAAVIALQSELALLRDENAQLRLERQQNTTPASSAAKVAMLVDTTSRTAESGEFEWATLGEALMLRESLASICNELERAVRVVRRQLQTATPSAELDRRQTDRRSQTPEPTVSVDLPAEEELPSELELQDELALQDKHDASVAKA